MASLATPKTPIASEELVRDAQAEMEIPRLGATEGPSMSEQADFVVLQPDGTVVYGAPDHNQGLRTAISAHVPDLSIQGTGRVRAWFADDFGGPDLYPNLLADQVLARLGYEHPAGRYRPVAVTMYEDMTGRIPPLASEVPEIVDELFVKADTTDTRAASHTAAFIDAAQPADLHATSATDIDSSPSESEQPSIQGIDTGVDL